MNRFAALVLVACSSPTRGTEAVKPVVSAPPVALPTAASASPIPTVHAAREVREAPHAGQMTTLALSPDGTTVLSADELGGVRLWPALDGTREPRIVDMPIADQLAIGRLTGGYAAVALDEAGGLYIAKLDDTGRQVSHTTMPAEPPIAGMAMTSLGLLAWRSDQMFMLVDADGAVKDKLGTEPQQRTIAVAVNGKRALVLLEREGTKREGRWLQLEPKLAWGAWVKLDGELGGAVELALSPNGKRLAMLVGPKPPDDPRKPVVAASTVSVYELGKAKPIVSQPSAQVSADIGFADDDHVAVGGLGTVVWLDIKNPQDKQQPSTPLSPGSRSAPSLAAGGGRAITPMNGDLALATPGKTEFLGYETVSPRIAEAGPKGGLLVGVGDHMLLLDQDLRGESTPFSKITGVTAELRWLGEQDWLIEGSTPNDGTMQIALVDGSQGNTVIRSGIKEVQILSYEPTTQLVTMSFGAESEVARFDRKARKLQTIASVKKTSPYEQVMFVPLAPSLARGMQLVQITMRDRSTVKWFRDAHSLDKPAATVTVDGPFAGADAAGHVFMWKNTPAGQLELVVYVDGKPMRTLPNTGAVALWPEPNGKRYVEVAPSTVAMYDLEGKQLWFQQLATSQEALWLSDGGIAITSAGGIARLDPATGAVTAARCGWRFGLAAKPHPATPRVEPLCAQLRR